MSVTLSPGVISTNGNTTAPNTFSVLNSMSQSNPSSMPWPNAAVPLAATPLASAQRTGLISATTPVVNTSAPAVVTQTVNTPVIPPPRASPSIPLVPVASLPATRMPTPNQMVITQPRTPTITMASPVQVPASPTARSALLNLNTRTTGSTVTIPVLTPTTIPRPSQDSLLLPSIKVATPSSSLPLKPTAQIMNQEFEIKDYQGIISNASLENELLNAGYAPLSKIVIRADTGDKRTQYIKAINKKGQKVFILIDVNGYTTARSTDLTLIEAHNASIVPYSLKTGAYECAGKDVCGVAFECGSDAVCVLSRGSQDLTPKEANFVFVEQHAPAAASIESEGTIMTYPVIRLSEIRANPGLVLANTDIVTRRLRNSSYTAELQELAAAQRSINRLNEAFVRFNGLREDSAGKLNRTLTQLERWNDIYMANPPLTDDAKDRYRRLQYNLAQRNEGISTLLRAMTKVAEKRLEIDVIAKEINDIADYAEKEFANVEFATSE